MQNRAQSLDEVFDVVDDNDCVIGRETRGTVHEKGLYHRAVHIFVWNDCGEIFLQKRSALKDRYPLCWSSSAAGHLDAGESYHEAALREVVEELGIKLPAMEKIAKISACPDTENEFVEVFNARHNGPFALCEAEIAEGGWFEREAVTEWINREPSVFARSFRKIWADVFDRK